MRVESIPDLVQDVRDAIVDLSGQVSADDCEIVDESVARPRSEPFKTQDVVLDFGSCDDVLGLAGEPFGVAGREDDRGPVEGWSDEGFAFAAVLL